MVVLGHRGANWQWGRFEENSMDAFRAAADEGMDGIETDVRVYDETLVLHHDPIKDANTDLVTLQSLLEWASDDFILNLEIKDKTAIEPLVDMIKSYPTKKYIVSSFWHKTVHHVKRNLPDVECGLLISFNPISKVIFKGLIPDTIDTIIWDHAIVERSMMEYMSTFKHMMYNVPNNNIENVDGIITDHV